MGGNAGDKVTGAHRIDDARLVLNKDEGALIAHAHVHCNHEALVRDVNVRRLSTNPHVLLCKAVDVGGGRGIMSGWAESVPARDAMWRA